MVLVDKDEHPSYKGLTIGDTTNDYLHCLLHFAGQKLLTERRIRTVVVENRLLTDEKTTRQSLN